MTFKMCALGLPVFLLPFCLYAGLRGSGGNEANRNQAGRQNNEPFACTNLFEGNLDKRNLFEEASRLLQSRVGLWSQRNPPFQIKTLRNQTFRRGLELIQRRLLTQQPLDESWLAETIDSLFVDSFDMFSSELLTLFRSSDTRSRLLKIIEDRKMELEMYFGAELSAPEFVDDIAWRRIVFRFVREKKAIDGKWIVDHFDPLWIEYLQDSSWIKADASCSERRESVLLGVGRRSLTLASSLGLHLNTSKQNLQLAWKRFLKAGAAYKKIDEQWMRNNIDTLCLYDSEESPPFHPEWPKIRKQALEVLNLRKTAIASYLGVENELPADVFELARKRIVLTLLLDHSLDELWLRDNLDPLLIDAFLIRYNQLTAPIDHVHAMFESSTPKDGVWILDSTDYMKSFFIAH